MVLWCNRFHGSGAHFGHIFSRSASSASLPPVIGPASASAFPNVCLCARIQMSARRARLIALNIPTRACISGPRSSAATNSASIAACHSSDCRVLPGGNAMMYLAASLSARIVLPPGRVIGSSKRRDHGIYFSGSRNRFMVNSIFADCRCRQLSTSVWYRSFG